MTGFKFMVARTPSNSISRQHDVSATPNRTACGFDVAAWSIDYTDELLPNIHCRLPGCKKAA